VEEIRSLVGDYSFRPDLSVFGITLDQCPPRIKKALGMIQRDFLNKELSVARIAFQLNIHRCHFEREFQRYCHISPKQLIIGLKLCFAAFLMQNQGMKLLHVAQLAGFPDYYEFCKIFCKHMGMTPRAFRSECCESNFPNHFMASNGRLCNKTTTNVTFHH
jgi:AraC-like DNA-binding protein